MGLARVIPPILAQPPRACCDLPLASQYHAAIADRAKVFGRVETEAADVADATEPPPAIAAARGLGAILYQGKAMSPRAGPNRVEIGGLAIKMHRDELVARADTERLKRQNQRIGAAGDADGFAAAAKLGKLMLERLDFTAEDIDAAFEDAIDRIPDRRFVGAVLRQRGGQGNRRRTHRVVTKQLRLRGHKRSSVRPRQQTRFPFRESRPSDSRRTKARNRDSVRRTRRMV